MSAHSRSRIGWTSIVLVATIALAGIVGTLVVATAMGVGAEERSDLLLLLVPAGIVTLAAALLARVALARASMRVRFVAVALLAAVIAIANIGVLTLRMTVSEHDATLVTVLLLYSAAAGVAGALVLARSSSAAVDRLGDAARHLGRGDLDTRIGALEAGPELDTLAATLDDMATSLQHAQERERDAEAMRRDLITAVSHDLRTPLASLRAMVEAIDDGVVADPPSLQRYTAEMRRSVAQLADMVDDLFELTQLDAGAIEAETARADLDQLVAEALASVAVEAENKRLRLEREIAGVEGVRCSPRIARVFDPFFRADPARSGPGAGLGLALAKRIVEALGGRITAEAATPAGTRFAVELPR